VGNLTRSITIPDTLTGGATERLVTFQAIGAVVGLLFLYRGDSGNDGRWQTTAFSPKPVGMNETN